MITMSVVVGPPMVNTPAVSAYMNGFSKKTEGRDGLTCHRTVGRSP